MSDLTVDDLRQHLFFSDFPESLVEFLQPLANEQTFRENETIITRGDDAESFYLIEDGLVIIELEDPSEGRVDIETLSEGDSLGWSWAQQPYVWQFSAKADSETECIEFPADELRERCEMEPELGYRIYRQLLNTVGDRLAGTRMQLLKEKDVELPEEINL